MGPRLVSRGKAQYEALKRKYDKLQWGRDLLVAERGLVFTIAARRVLASMGPRLVSRGKLDLIFGQWQTILASMGPRLVSRGKLALATAFLTIS